MIMISELSNAWQASCQLDGVLFLIHVFAFVLDENANAGKRH